MKKKLPPVWRQAQSYAIDSVHPSSWAVLNAKDRIARIVDDMQFLAQEAYIKGYRAGRATRKKVSKHV